MLTWEDDLEIHALHRRGWSISAIARHTKTNRRTVRNYLNGVTTPGVRKPASVDAFAPFVEYVTARLSEDPHLWARTLCDELEDPRLLDVLSDADKPDPVTQPAPGVSGLRPCHRLRQRGHRSPFRY